MNERLKEPVVQPYHGPVLSNKKDGAVNMYKTWMNLQIMLSEEKIISKCKMPYDSTYRHFWNEKKK